MVLRMGAFYMSAVFQGEIHKIVAVLLKLKSVNVFCE